MPRGIMSPQEVQVAAGGVLIRSMLDAERQPRGDFDRGRGFEGFDIDLGCKLLLIRAGAGARASEATKRAHARLTRRFPFIGVAQNLNRSCLLAAFWGATRMPVCLQER